MFDLAFYTCFYGSDNNLAFTIPPLPSLKYKCYYYTNNKYIFERLRDSKWIGIYDNKPVSDDLIESSMDSKHIKAMPHEYNELKDYSYLCYLDSQSKKVNETFVESFIFEYFIKRNYILLLREHWVRLNSEGTLALSRTGSSIFPGMVNSKPMGVWNEYNASVDQERYRLESENYKKYINNQINNGLSEITEHHCATGFLIRNMKHEKMNELNTTWYKHIQECGIECQISFFFVKQLFNGYVCSFNQCPFAFS